MFVGLLFIGIIGIVISVKEFFAVLISWLTYCFEGILHLAKKEQPGDLPPRLPSCHHDCQLVDGSQIYSNRTMYVHLIVLFGCPFDSEAVTRGYVLR